jgi:hypothetical protein
MCLSGLLILGTLGCAAPVVLLIHPACNKISQLFAITERKDRAEGADIWNPVASSDGMTYLSDFICQSCEETYMNTSSVEFKGIVLPPTQMGICFEITSLIKTFIYIKLL